MKTLFTALVICLAAVAVRADLLFSDNLNYSDGLIETDGLWYCFSPVVPSQDALVANHLLILNQNNHDAVAAPSTNFVNSSSTIVFASFTINVSSLPSASGGFFCEFKDNTNHYVSELFIDTKNTVMPGSYRLGIANFATSLSSAGVTNYPLDLITGATYQVVMSFDTDTGDPLADATLWINPASVSDPTTMFNVYGTDTTTNTSLTGIVISQIAFSQYANQGVAAIGSVKVGTAFGDVVAAPQLPVFGLQPQSANVYSGNSVTLSAAASGIGSGNGGVDSVSYQWLSNNVPLVDGANVSGSVSNTIILSSLQNTANYSVEATDSAGSVTSVVAVVTVNTTPTPAFFTTQPYGATNSYGSTITLSAVVNGTGPINYQWYFEPVGGGSFSALSGQTYATLYLDDVDYPASGSYYVTATGAYGSSTNSVTVTVQVVPPSLVTLGFLHGYLTNNPPSTYYYPVGTAQFTVQGVVTPFGIAVSGTYAEYFIQDGTGGALVYCNLPNTNLQPAGALVSVTGEVEQYYGELEIVANPTNVSVISYNNPMPAPALLNLPLMATNPMGTYGLGIQCSLVTLTNVYLYATTAGGAVSGTFPASSSKTLYAFQQPYSAGQPYMTIYVLTKTNAVNQLNTNFWGQPIPSFACQITGPLAIYSTTQPELDPTRYVDIVTNAPTNFAVGLTGSKGVYQLTWPGTNNNSTPTYSIYSATNVRGPWTRQTFGGYYPAGIYMVTNAAATQFYRVSTP